MAYYGVVPALVRQRLRQRKQHLRVVACALLLALAAASVVLHTHSSSQWAHQHVVVAAARHEHDAWSSDEDTQQHAPTTTAAAALPRPAAFNATGWIPRLLHQNYMAGPEQLLQDALRPLSHFRKEWWTSCKTHHPGWQHMLWDAAACEQLLRQHYPWFLDTWRALGTVVLKSDAIRPFILHAYGGVYLDLDSECFADMAPWLAGAQLVLQAEVGHTINNAQMASVPGHPLWPAFQRGIQSRVAAGKRWPLETTGPHLLTDIFRNLTGNARADLPGAYTLADGSRVAVYGPEQWFTPCAWNDWSCAVNVARGRPVLRAAAKVAVAAAHAQLAAARVRASHSLSNKTNSVPAAAAANASSVTAAAAAAVATMTPAASAAAQGFPVMMGVRGVAGVHHFSGSWLGLDGSKSLSLRKEGVSGAASFLYSGNGFVEQPCTQLALLPQDTPAAAASPAVPVCWEDISRAAAAGNCTVLSVRSQPPGCITGSSSNEQQQQQQKLRQWLGAELALAGAGCLVKLVTSAAVDIACLAAPLPADASSQPQAGTAPSNSSSSSQREVLGRISSVTAVLGVAPDPFAEPPVHTLDTLVAAELGSSTRLTLLLLDLTAADGDDDSSSSSSSGGSASVLDVLNQLYISSSTVLQRADSLVLTLPQQQRAAAAAAGGAPSSTSNAHKAFAAYQHLFQESGFVGYHHWHSTAAPADASTTTSPGATRLQLPAAAAVLGLTQRRVADSVPVG